MDPAESASRPANFLISTSAAIADGADVWSELVSAIERDKHGDAEYASESPFQAGSRLDLAESVCLREAAKVGVDVFVLLCRFAKYCSPITRHMMSNPLPRHTAEHPYTKGSSQISSERYAAGHIEGLYRARPNSVRWTR